MYQGWYLTSRSFSKYISLLKAHSYNIIKKLKTLHCIGYFFLVVKDTISHQRQLHLWPVILSHCHIGRHVFWWSWLQERKIKQRLGLRLELELTREKRHCEQSSCEELTVNVSNWGPSCEDEVTCYNSAVVGTEDQTSSTTTSLPVCQGTTKTAHRPAVRRKYDSGVNNTTSEGQQTLHWHCRVQATQSTGQGGQLWTLQWR